MNYNRYIRNQLASYFYLIEANEDRSPEDYRNLACRFLDAYTVLESRLSNMSVDDSESPQDVAIQTVFYDVGKAFYGEDKESLLRWFQDIYIVLGGKMTGPRPGQFVALLGIDVFLDHMSNRIYNPFMFPEEVIEDFTFVP